jgi:hypothetical protein
MSDSPTSTLALSLSHRTISITSIASTSLTLSIQPPARIVNVNSRHVLRLSGTAWETVLATRSDNVVTAVAIDIATALRIDRNRIQIDSLAVGSLVVTFTVIANSTSQQINSAGVTHLIETQFSPASTQFVYAVTSGTTESVTLLETYSVGTATASSCGTGCVVGIIVGSAAAAVGIFAAAIIFYRRRQSAAAPRSGSTNNEPHDQMDSDQEQQNDTVMHRKAGDFEPLQLPPTDPRRNDWLTYNRDTAVVDVFDVPLDTPIAPPFEMPISTRIVHDDAPPITEVVFRDDDYDDTGTDDPMQESFSSSVLHISGDDHASEEDRSSTPVGMTPRKYPARTTPPATPRGGRKGGGLQLVRRPDGGGLVAIDSAFIAQYSQTALEPPTAHSRVRFAEDAAFDGAEFDTTDDNAQAESWESSSSASQRQQPSTSPDQQRSDVLVQSPLAMIHVVTTDPHGDDDGDSDIQDGSLQLEDPFQGQGGEWDWEFAELPQSSMLRLPTDGMHVQGEEFRTSDGAL